MYAAPSAQPGYGPQPGYGAPAGYPAQQPGYPGQPPMQPGYPGQPPMQPGYPGAQPGYAGAPANAGYWGKFKESKKAKGGVGCCCVVTVIVVILIIVIGGGGAALVGKLAQCGTVKYVGSTDYDITGCDGLYLGSYAQQVWVTPTADNVLRIHEAATNVEFMNSTTTLLRSDYTNKNRDQILGMGEINVKALPNAAIAGTISKFCVFKSQIADTNYGKDCYVHGFEIRSTQQFKLIAIHGYGIINVKAPGRETVATSQLYNIKTNMLEYSLEKNTMEINNAQVQWVHNEFTTTHARDISLLGGTNTGDNTDRSMTKTGLGDNLWHFKNTAPSYSFKITCTRCTQVLGFDNNAYAQITYGEGITPLGTSSDYVTLDSNRVNGTSYSSVSKGSAQGYEAAPSTASIRVERDSIGGVTSGTTYIVGNPKA